MGPTKRPWFGLTGVLSFCLVPWVLPGTPSIRAVPLRERPSKNLRTYRFKARIKANNGVTPFKVGKVITGTFTYDVAGKGEDTPPVCGMFHSGGNALSFQVGQLHFKCIGDILVTTGLYKYAEHFQVVAPDLQLPRGWQMDHTRRSQTYSVLFQNAPPKGVVPRKQPPDRLSLSSWVNTRELLLDFYHGVRFPGGQVNKRATVVAVVESMEEVRANARPRKVNKDN